MKNLLFFFIILETLQKSDVYFTKHITSSKMVEMFKKLNINLTGKVGLKIHSGESGGLYFLKPDFLQEIYDYTKGDFLECNTAYQSARSSTSSHKQLLQQNGWTDKGRNTVIMDENPEDDFQLNITKYEMIKENYVGGHLKEYDSCVVLSHFKGHQMGGFGGALKQLSIGFASQRGKTWIHTAGKYTEWSHAMRDAANQENFTAAMADAASSIVDYFRNKGQIAFITVLANISKSCDCAGASAPAPKIKDIGILSSTDPVAIDRAALDLLKKNVDTGTDDLFSQINRLKGENTINIAAKLGVGSLEYNLINVDEEQEEDVVQTQKQEMEQTQKQEEDVDSKDNNFTNTKNEGTNISNIIYNLNLFLIILLFLF